MRVAPRTSEVLLKYSLPCPKKGDGQNDYFLDTSVHGKRESTETVCEFCVVCVYYDLCNFAFASLRLFRLATRTCFSFLACERNDLRKISISNLRECFFVMPLFLPPPHLFFICDLCDFETTFFLPPGVIATHSRRENNSEGVQRGTVAKAHGAGRGEGEGGGGDEVGDEASKEPDDDVMEGVEKGDVVPVIPGSERFSVVAGRLLGVSLYGRMSGLV